MSAAIVDRALNGKRVVVMGLGRFGGGVGVTRFLVDRGASVLVTDCADASTLGTSLAAIEGLAVELRLGEHVASDLDGADLLVVSPAVDRRKSAFFQDATSRRVPWTTEMNLFLERCPARILGVTGTIGKSTTCAMLHTILSDAAAGGAAGVRRALLGGNIGQSLLASLDEMRADDAVVLELSSFQLEVVVGTSFRPSVAGLTNTRPHHLDRHGDFEQYLDAKLNLFRALPAGAVAVVGTDDSAVVTRMREVADSRGVRVVEASYDGTSYDLRVAGRHNQMNAHFAVALAEAFGVGRGAGRETLRSFSGLAHRLQFVGVVSEVRYYNDSKSTSPEAVSTALEAFDQPIVLLCGGKDIGAELDGIAGCRWDHVRAVICFGEAGPRLAKLLSNASELESRDAVQDAGTLEQAVEAARRAARPGDVVILSPGCPSYDAFTNYEARGDAFVSLVRS